MRKYHLITIEGAGRFYISTTLPSVLERISQQVQKLEPRGKIRPHHALKEYGIEIFNLQDTQSRLRTQLLAYVMDLGWEPFSVDQGNIHLRLAIVE